MHLDWSAIQKRLIQKDENGQYLVAVTGVETDRELRAVAARLSHICPACNGSVGCPFKMLSGLTPNSRHRTLELMDRQALMEMLQLEQACRAEVFNKNLPQGGQC